MKPVIIAVDDDMSTLDAIVVLCDDYDLRPMLLAENMFEYLEKGIMPDIILLDIYMDGMNGFEAAQKLKADDRYKDIPIIFISADKSATTIKAAMQVGAFDFIGKPFNYQRLETCIDKALREVKKR